MNIHPLLALRDESAQYHAGNVEVLEGSPIGNPGHSISTLEEQEAYYILRITHSNNPYWKVGTFLEFTCAHSYPNWEFLHVGIKAATWFSSAEDATRALRIFNHLHSHTSEGTVGAAVMRLEYFLSF